MPIRTTSTSPIRSRQAPTQGRRMTLMAKDIFDRLEKRRPKDVKSDRDVKLQHAQKILDWLQRWNKDTVCERDFRLYGPRPRDRESITRSTRILIRNGWLSPAQARR